MADLFAGDRVALGMWVKLPISESIEAAHLGGYDFVVLDLEHSSIDVRTAAVQLALARALGLAALVRIPLAAEADFARLLDAGASGFVIPHVESAEEALRSVALTRFPPVGERGAGPTSRAGTWGETPLADYLTAGADVVLIVQIETKSAAAQVLSIASIAGIDGVLIGKVDLAVSMGEEPSSHRVAEVVDNIVQQVGEAEVRLGTAVADGHEVPSGYRFILVSNDASLLVRGARRTVDAARDALLDR